MIRQKIRIGDLLVDQGLITQEQLLDALKLQKESNFTKKLGQIFIDDGVITQRTFIELLASQLKIDFIDLFSIEVDFHLMGSFQISMLKNSDAIPFKEDNDFIYVAVSDPLNYGAIELLEKSIAVKPIKLYIALASDIAHVFGRLEIISVTKTIVTNIKREIAKGVGSYFR